MKKSLSLVLAMLAFVVLGCSALGGLTGQKDDAPTPVPDTQSTPTDTTTSTPSTTSDSAGKANLSMEIFNKINLGMSYDDVKGIVGSDGDNTASSKSGSYESKTYQWKGERFARISARFRNGKLVYKYQGGITSAKDGTADINQAKFNKINTGMSYEEVKKELGSEGEMTSASQSFGNSINTSYVWRGPKFASIRASFKDNKMTNKNQSGLK